MQVEIDPQVTDDAVDQQRKVHDKGKQQREVYN